MTPHEKAVNAINARIEQLQANLRIAKSETAQQFIFQALVVTIGLAETLNDYIQSVARYAERRHVEVKQASETHAAQHASLLDGGKELLAKLKANPSDKALRKEIDRVQQAMASVQKAVRRDANALRRELAPSLAAIDRMSESVRRFSGAEESIALKRAIGTLIREARAFCAEQAPAVKQAISETWENAVATEIDQAAGFHDAYARAGFQAMLVIEVATLALAENPPETPDDVSPRIHESAAARLKAITARLTSAAP